MLKLPIRNSQKGFSLLELLVVITLIGAISAIGVSSFSNYNKKVMFAKIVSGFVDTLNTAKSNAYAQVKPSACVGSLSAYTVTTAGDGKSYALNVACTGGTPVNIKTTNLPSGVTLTASKTIRFNLFTGSVSGGGDIILSGYDSTKTVNIDSNGVITE